jgi:succinoglycan biosynthesis protein ExoA
VSPAGQEARTSARPATVPPSQAAPSSATATSSASATSRGLVTVVVPARNEEHTIAGVLDCVLSQTYPDLEVLVVDGDSTDHTAEIVERYAGDDPRVELLRNPERVIPVAMNLAVARARGIWLVRVDAHSRIPSDYVERLVEHLATGRWGGVGGRKNAVGHTGQGRAIAAVMGSKFGQGNSVYHYGVEPQVVDHVPFGAYPLDTVRDLGGWSEDQLVNEDFEFDYRLRRSGRELLFDPAVEIMWDCRQRVPDLFQQYRRYGAGKVMTLRKHPESVALRHLAAPTMVGGLAVAAVLLPWRRTRVVGAVLAAPYLAVVAAGTATTVTAVRGARERAWLAPAFLALHLGWGIGFWSELLRPAGRRGRRQAALEASAGSSRGHRRASSPR